MTASGKHKQFLKKQFYGALIGATINSMQAFNRLWQNVAADAKKVKEDTILEIWTM